MSPTCSIITMSVTVSVLVTKWGLFFTKPGVKTNRQYCWDILLSQQILDTMKRVTHRHTDGNFIFQQNDALMLVAFNTVQLVQCKHPSSFLSGLWLQNGPELNFNDVEI